MQKASFRYIQFEENLGIMSQKELNPDFVDTEPILILLSTIHKNILGVNLRFFKTGFQKSTSCYCRFTFPLK